MYEAYHVGRVTDRNPNYAQLVKLLAKRAEGDTNNDAFPK